MTANEQDLWPYPGSRWWKFDFHAHTPASSDSWWARNGEELSPEDWLLRYMNAEVDCVAVTDHNIGEWVDKLKRAYMRMKERSDADPVSQNFRELTLFPGVEISVQGGLHLLAILDPNAGTSDIDTLLGHVEYDGTKGNSDGVTRKGAAAVVDEVLKFGAIPIPAHIDGPKGLLEMTDTDPPTLKHDANTIGQFLDERGILAMEVVDRTQPKPDIYRGRDLSWAEVLGSDCHSLKGGHCPGSRYTWVKMAKPSLEGLRLALLDGNDISLRRSDDHGEFEPFRVPSTFITRIDVEGTRFMGNGAPETLEFTPFYNALIGGRGTGKSTVVQALRLAYRRDSDMKRFGKEAELRRWFERFAQVFRARDRDGALRENTEVRVTLMRDGIAHQLRWRQDGQGSVVEERGRDGGWQASVSQAINPERFPIRLLSQGQIAAMAAENRQALLDIIDEAAKVGELRSDFDEEMRKFLSLRARLRVVEGRLEGRPELQRKLADVKRQLEAFTQSRHADVLKAHQGAARQHREVDETLAQLQAVPERIEAFVRDLLLDDWHDGIFHAERDADILAWRAESDKAVGNLCQSMTDAADQFAAKTAALASDTRLTQWRQRADEAKFNYDALQEMLASQGVTDPLAFGRLVQEHQQIEAQGRELDQLEQEREQLNADCEVQWQLIFKLRKEITRARSDFVSDTLHANDFVKIAVVPFGFDARVIERDLRDLLDVLDERFESDILHLENELPVSGLAFELATAEDRERNLAQVKKRIIDLDKSFGGHFRNYLGHRLKRPEFGDRVRCWFPEDDLRIEYRRGHNCWVPITEGSQGQRSAALLAFLLAFGDEPLVLDQPEDDLDNHLIYDLIVRQIRENKLRRQLLIVTHNPNVVVNGDAEMVHALNFKNGQCQVVERGALQDVSVREEVCRVMEGGREAFARRWARLGRGTTNVR